MADINIPASYTSEEAWIIDNKVDQVKTSYVMTSSDTCDDYITLKSGERSVTWLTSTFNRIATLASSVHGTTSSLVEPKEYGLRERIAKRRAWEQKEAADLAEYKRLQEKFKGHVDES